LKKNRKLKIETYPKNSFDTKIKKMKMPLHIETKITFFLLISLGKIGKILHFKKISLFLFFPYFEKSGKSLLFEKLKFFISPYNPFLKTTFL